MAIRSNDQLKKPIAVTEGVLLLVEGPNDQRLFGKLAETAGISSIQIVSMGGKNDWTPSITAITNAPGFASNVRALGLVRDADDDAGAAFASLTNTLSAASFPVPAVSGTVATAATGLRGGAMVLPDGTTTGELEDLCATSVDGTDRMVCVDTFMTCMAASQGIHPELAKARIAAYISGHEAPYLRLGEAAEAGVFPLASAAFAPVRAFLQSLAGPAQP